MGSTKEQCGWTWDDVGPKSVKCGIPLGRLACPRCGSVASGAFYAPQCPVCEEPFWPISWNDAAFDEWYEWKVQKNRQRKILQEAPVDARKLKENYKDCWNEAIRTIMGTQRAIYPVKEKIDLRKITQQLTSANKDQFGQRMPRMRSGELGAKMRNL